MEQDNTPNGGGPSKNEGADDVDDGYLDSFPPGYRFCPHDVELLQHYLNKKVLGLPLPPNRISEVNLYNYNPERLAELYKQYGEKEWYFFTPREKKYRNGIRPNRSAGDGYWKATGADREIKSNDCVIGYRKALVFYQGKAPKGDKTNWIMHEYRVENPPSPKKDNKGYNDMRLDDYVLCRIYNKANNKPVRTESKIDDSISPLPIVENEDANEILASDHDMINSSMNENFSNQVLPDQSLNNFEQNFDESFQIQLPDLPTKYSRYRTGDLWSAVEGFVNYDPSPLQICEPLMNLDLPVTASNNLSQGFRCEQFQEEESMKEYQRNFYDFKRK